MSGSAVTALPNIGATLSRRLASIGVESREDLANLGSVRVYQLLCEKEQRRLPVCYNLYSIEAALRGHDWRLLDSDDKTRLKQEAGLQK